MKHSDHDAVSNEWGDAKNTPVRAGVGAARFRPELLVEIMVVASKQAKGGTSWTPRC